MQKITAHEIRKGLIDMGINPISADLFLGYNHKRPEIWKEFEAMALHLCESGEKQFGAKAVVEKIRWEREQSRNDKGEYAISNSMVSCYARVFVLKYPEYRNRIVLKEAHGPLKEAA